MTETDMIKVWKELWKNREIEADGTIGWADGSLDEFKNAGDVFIHEIKELKQVNLALDFTIKAIEKKYGEPEDRLVRYAMEAESQGLHLHSVLTTLPEEYVSTTNAYIASASRNIESRKLLREAELEREKALGRLFDLQCEADSFREQVEVLQKTIATGYCGECDIHKETILGLEKLRRADQVLISQSIRKLMLVETIIGQVLYSDPCKKCDNNTKDTKCTSPICSVTSKALSGLIDHLNQDKAEDTDKLNIKEYLRKKKGGKRKSVKVGEHSRSRPE